MSPGRDSDEAELREVIQAKLAYALGKTREAATDADWYHATALAVRDRVINIFLAGARRDQAAEEEARLLPLDRIPDRPPAVRHADESAAGRADARGAREALAPISIACARSSRTPRSAMAGLAGSPPAISTACRRSASPPMATASATRMACSSSAFSDGWQQEFPEDWLAHGNPWELNRREAPYSIGFGGTVEYLGGDDDTARALWYPAERVLAVPYDTPIAGWRGRHANMLRLWSARAVDADPARGVQSRRLRRRHRGAGAERGDLALPLSQRLDAGGTGAAAAAGIFLHVGLAAGPGAAGISTNSPRSTISPITPRCSSTTRIRRSRSPS